MSEAKSGAGISGASAPVASLMRATSLSERHADAAAFLPNQVAGLFGAAVVEREAAWDVRAAGHVETGAAGADVDHVTGRRRAFQVGEDRAGLGHQARRTDTMKTSLFYAHRRLPDLIATMHRSHCRAVNFSDLITLCRTYSKFVLFHRSRICRALRLKLRAFYSLLPRDRRPERLLIPRAW